MLVFDHACRSRSGNLYEPQEVAIGVLHEHFDLTVLDVAIAIPGFTGFAERADTGSFQTTENRSDVRYLDLEVQAPTEWGMKGSRDPALRMPLFKHELRAVEIKIDETILRSGEANREPDQVAVEMLTSREVLAYELRHQRRPSPIVHDHSPSHVGSGVC